LSERFKVCVADFLDCDLDVERATFGNLADAFALCALSEDELVGSIEDADAIMLYHVISMTERTLRRLKHCKLIVRCGVGFDNVDWRLARQLGIPVANVPDYGTEEVADSAIGMMLALARGIHLLNSRLRDRLPPWHYSPAETILRLRGRVFGIVGCGRIGGATALRAKALGMDVVFYDPYVPDGREKSLGIRRCETVEELLRQSYALSLHCPHTPETRHLINGETLRWLPAGAYLVNTARGAIVDARCLPAALESGHLAGVGLDVLEGEPPSDDDPLLIAWRDPSHPAYHRVILNPHSAFYSVDGLRDMRRKGSEACRRALLGLPLRNVVN
jgi:D-3-phosphoglycerate dehydrogenase/C-terminal binding protein